MLSSKSRGQPRLQDLKGVQLGTKFTLLRDVLLRCLLWCCREGRITEAMQFAQSVLAGLKPGAAHSDSQLRVRPSLRPAMFAKC